MGRPALFDEAQLLDAVERLVATEGPAAATTRRLAASVGAPTGSLYHRFGSRDLLVGQAWLRAVAHFQAGFLDALDVVDVDEAAVGAARHVPLWAARHPDRAGLLLRFRRAELVACWPQSLTEELGRLNGRVERALRAHARQRYGASREGLLLVRYALVDLPQAAVRSAPSPAALVDAVAAAAIAALRSRPTA